MQDKMILYHTGFETIKEPDVHLGRRNADFGQGFYLTADAEFAHRWARERKGRQAEVNTYELDTTDLTIHRFDRNVDWFQYIFENRRGNPDVLSADVVIGPIANDTIYDTFGIITSGFLKPEDAMKLLMIGPEYHQIALKTAQAVKQLKWISSEILSSEKLSEYRSTVIEEEKNYQTLFAGELEKITTGI